MKSTLSLLKGTLDYWGNPLTTCPFLPLSFHAVFLACFSVLLMTLRKLCSSLPFRPYALLGGGMTCWRTQNTKRSFGIYLCAECLLSILTVCLVKPYHTKWNWSEYLLESAMFVLPFNCFSFSTFSSSSPSYTNVLLRTYFKVRSLKKRETFWGCMLLGIRVLSLSMKMVSIITR